MFLEHRWTRKESAHRAERARGGGAGRRGGITPGLWSTRRSSVTRVEERSPGPDPTVLGRRARLARMVAATIGLLLVTAGTAFGSDDDFPVGPLRMYSVRDDPNGTVTQAVVLAVTATGRTVDVTDTSGAPRRAELEGRLGALEGDPSTFASVARTFMPGSGRIDGDAVVEIRLVQRSFRLHSGRAGPAADRVVAAWRVPL